MLLRKLARTVYLGVLLLLPLLANMTLANSTVHGEDLTKPALTTEVLALWTDEELGNTETENTEIWNQRGENNDSVTQINRPTLTVYHPTSPTASRTAVVVCPGGGYGGLAIDKEGFAIAKWFADNGITAGVLKYRCGGGPNQHPVPINDAKQAVRLMRANADEWNIDAGQVGILGFSAGGHLAASVATDEEIDVRFAVLVYPVISMVDGVTHGGSRKNLLGDAPSEALIRELSCDERVTAKTCPTMLIHAADDAAVPVENSLRFYAAMQKNKIAGELHVYDRGGHGFGLYRGDRPADRWGDATEAWMKINGWWSEANETTTPADSMQAMMDDTQPGWRALSEQDFVHVNSHPDTWSWTDGVLHCTGNPVSVLRTAEQYKNFEMVIEWMHEKPAGNSGCFVWTTPESIKNLTAAGKPGLPSGIEVQILDHGYTTMLAKAGRATDWFGTNGDVFPVGVRMTPFPPLSPDGSRSFPRQLRCNGHGQWNQYYIRAINGEVRLWVNGEEVSGGTGIEPSSGYLCLESEGSPIQFRKLRIRELP